MKKEMKKERNNILIFFLIFFIITTLLLAGYIYYDKNLKSNQTYCFSWIIKVIKG